MNFSHQSPSPHPAAPPWQWALEAERALPIAPARQGRWLQVEQGRVWLTETQRQGQAQDQWLLRGERLFLPAGSAWVAEGFGGARVSVFQAPPRAAGRFLGTLVLLARAASAACSAKRAQGCIKAGESRASSGAV
jgi:Protein of unknown function (DUF2917)